MGRALTVVVLMFALSACGHCKDMFAGKSDQHLAKLLLQASRSAEGHLGIKQAAGGYAYSDCMQIAKPNRRCEQLYTAMLQYLHQHTGFATLHLNQLTDRQLYHRIQKSYQQLCYEGIV